MAKLQSIPFKFESQAGEVLEFTSNVSVNSQGLFSINVPAELKESLESLSKSLGLGVQRARKNLYVSGRDLSDCKQLIENAAEDYLKCEIKRECIILYKYINDTTYYKDFATGEIFPNGTYVDDYQGNKGAWKGSLDATHRSGFYSVGLSAMIVDKISYIRASGTRIEYDRPDDVHTFSPETYKEKLASFCGLWHYEPAEMSEIPYTEEAAKFFFETMMGLCKLADRLEMFFEDDKNVTRAIKSQAKLLAWEG